MNFLNNNTEIKFFHDLSILNDENNSNLLNGEHSTRKNEKLDSIELSLHHLSNYISQNFILSQELQLPSKFCKINNDTVENERKMLLESVLKLVNLLERQEKHLSEKKEDIHSLECDKEDLNKRNQDLNTLLDRAKKQLGAAKNNERHFKEQIDALNKQLYNEKRESTNMIKILTQKDSQYQLKIQKLEKELSQLKQKFNTAIVPIQINKKTTFTESQVKKNSFFF